VIGWLVRGRWLLIFLTFGVCIWGILEAATSSSSIGEYFGRHSVVTYTRRIDEGISIALDVLPPPFEVASRTRFRVGFL
jgi:hypothetical protein